MRIRFLFSYAFLKACCVLGFLLCVVPCMSDETYTTDWDILVLIRLDSIGALGGITETKSESKDRAASPSYMIP